MRKSNFKHQYGVIPLDIAQLFHNTVTSSLLVIMARVTYYSGERKSYLAEEAAHCLNGVKPGPNKDTDNDGASCIKRLATGRNRN